DNRTGGFIVRSKKAGSLNSEQQDVVNFLFGQGERIVIPEAETASHLASEEVELNGANFAIQTVAGKGSMSQQIADATNQAGNLVLNIRTRTDKNELKKGLASVKGRKGLNTVMVLYDNKRTVITKKEILNKDFKALDSLFN
ncbi:MAG TPA: hypothetical protein VKQ52_12405, partial [Puia sp.]|nr:hypothetical protein [Puia sp.]